VISALHRQCERASRAGRGMERKTPAWRALIIALVFALIAVVSIGSPSSAKNGKDATPSKSKTVPRLVDVGADKCIPCIMMAPVLDELRKEYAGALQVEFVDVWKNPKAGEKYGIRGIPTQIFYDASGKELYRHMGFISKEQILETFKELGIDLKKSRGQKKR
jgi:thioredoxin 1